MSVPSTESYLADIAGIMRGLWPDNRTVNIVCHGHSVPAGYFATPVVDTFNAYPHLLHRGLKHRFPFSVTNVIVTAIGGETSETGAARFDTEVLCHRPDVVTIDYGLNDRGVGLAQARISWRTMIDKATSADAKVILLTPTLDVTQSTTYAGADRDELPRHAKQIRELASELEVGLADSSVTFERYSEAADLSDLLSWSNHPNRNGHELVAREILRWFPAA